MLGLYSEVTAFTSSSEIYRHHETVWLRIQMLLDLALERARRLYVTFSLQLVGAKALGLVLQGTRVNYSTESKFKKASGDSSLFSVVILKQSEAPV